jgi:hypothetical protein
VRPWRVVGRRAIEGKFRAGVDSPDDVLAPQLRGSPASRQRPDARQQFVKRERLDKIVVGAGVQALKNAIPRRHRGVSIRTGASFASRRSRRQSSNPSSPGSMMPSTIAS